MTVVGDLVDVGFLGISGFGIWSGRTLWGRCIELKHEREMARLSMDRTEKSIRLEIEQNQALAAIQQREGILATEQLRIEKMRPVVDAGDP